MRAYTGSVRAQTHSLTTGRISCGKFLKMMPLEYRACAEGNGRPCRTRSRNSRSEPERYGQGHRLSGIRTRGSRLRSGRGADQDIIANSCCRCPRRTRASRPRAAWIAAFRIATTAARSITRSRTGTTSSIAAIGKRPRAIFSPPTIFRNSPAAFVRRHARLPARSISMTIRSPSKPWNARLPTGRSRAAGSSRSPRRTRPARKSP